MKKKVVLYYCTSVYQILILTIMVELYYHKYRNIVIIEQDLADKLYYEALNAYMDEVFVLSSEVSKYEIEKLLFQIYKKNDIILFGMFTWGIHGAFIYDKIPQEVPVVLLDEGVSTCEYKKFMTYAVGTIDFSKIKEIWMIDPQISQNDKLVPEYRIPLEDLITNKERFSRYLNVVNQMFAYQYEEFKGDILFFDRYLVQLNRIPIKYERFVLESLIKLAGDRIISVKTHPSEERGLAEWRYRDLPVNFYKDSAVPWELVVLNSMYHSRGKEKLSGFPKVLIATNTTTLFITQSLLQSIGMEIPIIYINRIIHHYLRDVEVVAEKTIEEYQQIYKERKVFLPNSWSEFYEALEICIPNFTLVPDKLVEVYENENKLLTDEYRKTLKVEGNLLQRIYLEVLYKEVQSKTEKKQIFYSYIIGGENKYSVTFTDFSIKSVDELSIRFFPAGIPPVYRNVVLRKVSYYRNNEQEEIYFNKEFILSNKTPYMFFEILSQEDEIKELEIIFTTQKEYQVLFATEQAIRFQNYFDNLIKWVKILQQGDCFSEYCRNRNYRSIGIYGNGKLGILLNNQLRNCNIYTVIIDQKELEGCISVSEALLKLEEFDLIVITPLFDYYNIHKTFGFSKKVIGLDDFLDKIEVLHDEDTN